MGISVLPIHLVNKIAAGEVIERPASIVKELAENSIDSGATRIDVAIEDGGRKLISVTDDGCGMSAEDLALAFTPHATSKLSNEDDLFQIATMGFRGEALASISSISHAHIRTRRRDDESGYEIQASGETIEQVRPCPAAPGTTVTIRDLFFNTPARRKFMRKANTEAGHVSEQLARLALPNPNIAFTLTHNGRKTQNLPPSDSTRQRISDLFTGDLADSLLKIGDRKSEISISGLIATPAAARGSAKWQYFFLNGRYIRDRLLAHALREAYRGLIAPNQFPVAFIFIDVNPADVDVNVHPTKIEVRFRDSQRVHGEMLAALKDTLNKSNLAPRASLDSETDIFAPRQQDQDTTQRQGSMRQALADFFKSAPPVQPRFNFTEPHARGAEKEFDRPNASQRPFTRPPTTHETNHGFTDLPNQPPPFEEPPKSHAMQIHNSYIVTACDDGLMIVDQHALHERVMYNEFQRRLAQGRLAGQRLLIPETINVTAGENDLIVRHGDLLKRLGIEVESFGPDTMAIQQFPSLLIERGVSAGPFLRELLDKLGEDETTDSERILENVLSMLSCKAAVKAGDPLTAAEIDSLLEQRETIEKASSCPHGRPTTIILTLKNLEKQFKRT